MGSDNKYLVFQAPVLVLLHVPPLVEIAAVCPGEVGGVIDDCRPLALEELIQFQVCLCIYRVAEQLGEEGTEQRFSVNLDVVFLKVPADVPEGGPGLGVHFKHQAYMVCGCRVRHHHFCADAFNRGRLQPETVGGLAAHVEAFQAPGIVEQLVIAKCFAKRVFDPARIALLISYIEKLSHTTFEGNYFSTGFILTRSLYDYKLGKDKQRDGTIYTLENSNDIVRNPNINKRFWYLVNGKESFYLFDQKLVINNSFFLSNIGTSWKRYFDSYFLKSVLYGNDIAFRTIGPNQVSIMNADSIEFVKIENSWKLRDYNYLKKFIDFKISVGQKVKSALIYYIARCSRESTSSIIWLPKKKDEKNISKVLPTKSCIFSPVLSILSTSQEESIMRILSSDGVTVIDKSGKIIYHGGIVDLNAGITKGLAGTGETAARILSDNGIAIKISQDGNIKIFYSIQEKPFIF